MTMLGAKKKRGASTKTKRTKPKKAVVFEGGKPIVHRYEPRRKDWL